MIEGKFLSGQDDLAEVFYIRKKVFVDEQGISPEEEFDLLDQDAVHVLIFSGNKPVATGRLLLDDGKYKAGRIAVLKEERGKMYGDFVVRILADHAFQAGAEHINVGAQISARGFYEKIGFVCCGEEYEEAGIPHIPMELKKSTLCSACQRK